LKKLSTLRGKTRARSLFKFFSKKSPRFPWKSRYCPHFCCAKWCSEGFCII